jgi:hypothetical protein
MDVTMEMDLRAMEFVGVEVSSGPRSVLVQFET